MVDLLVQKPVLHFFKALCKNFILVSHLDAKLFAYFPITVLYMYGTVLYIVLCGEKNLICTNSMRLALLASSTVSLLLSSHCSAEKFRVFIYLEKHTF